VRRPQPKKSTQGQHTGKEGGVGDGAASLNPDPAVFEAAFVLDDSEDPSRAGTPKPVEKKEKEKEDADVDAMASGENKTRGTESGNEKSGSTNASPPNEKESGKGSGADSPGTPDATQSTARDGTKKPQNDDMTAATIASAELPLDVRVKLRKFDRLEATYTGWIFLLCNPHAHLFPAPPLPSKVQTTVALGANGLPCYRSVTILSNRPRQSQGYRTLRASA